MQYVPIGVAFGLVAYQNTITYLIKRNRDDHRRILYQIDANETHNRKLIRWAAGIDPKKESEYNYARDTVLQLDTEKCIYWEGKDITISEARELAHIKKEKCDRYLSVSPFDRLASFLSE